MATEGQIGALGKWLKVAVSQKLDFELASSALARLHEASEKYNENKSKNKGIVSETKKDIIKELREAGYLLEDEDQTELKEEEEKPKGKTLNSTIKKEEEPAALPKYEQEIIDEVAKKLSACTAKAEEIAKKYYKYDILTPGEQAIIVKEIAATLLIQAARGGL